MTKLPEELHHILGEVAHTCPAFCGFGEFDSYVIGLIDSLANTERAFDFISLSHGLGHQCLPLGTWRLLRWSSERLAVVLDLEVFQYGPVGSVHIDFVCQDSCRQEAEALLVLVNLELQVCTLVIGIPAVMVDEVVPPDDAHAYLGSELHLCGGFSPDDGAHMGLEDADDAVFASVPATAEHPVLLEVHLHSGIKYPLLILAKAVEAVAELSGSKVHQRENISVQTAKHLPDGFPDLLAMTAITAMQYNLLSTVRRFSGYETVGGLFKDATKSSVELTLTERIWDIMLEMVREIALCFNIEDEQIFDTLVNRSDKLSHFVELYQLKLAS